MSATIPKPNARQTANEDNVPITRQELPRAVNVAFLIDRLCPGGTELQLLSLIRHLDRSRIRPWLVVLDGSDDVSQSLEPSDCPVIRLGVTKLKSINAIRQLRRVCRILKNERIDVLQMYGYRDSVAFGVMAGRLAGTPYTVRVRNNLGHWMTARDRWLFRLLNRGISATLTNSDAARQAAIEQEGISPASITILENGVELDQFSARIIRHPLSTKQFPTVGVVGNLRRVKGVDVFLEAAASIRREITDARFLIAGDGWERAALEHRAAMPDLAGAVIFLGQIRDIPSILRQLDVAVLPSRAEGMSNALIEYMAVGLPIVATAVGGATELIQDGIHGRLVPPDDSNAIAQATIGFIQNIESAKSLGHAAREKVRTCFNPKARADKYAEYCENLRVLPSTM